MVSGRPNLVLAQGQVFGLLSLVLGPFGPDLGPDLDLTWDLDLDLSLTIGNKVSLSKSTSDLLPLTIKTMTFRDVCIYASLSSVF